MSDPLDEFFVIVREELDRADSKASILLAGLGVAYGVFFAAVLASDWSPATISPRWAWLWWVGLTLLTGAAAMLGAAVYPRLYGRGGPGPSGRTFYFGDVAKAKRPEDALKLVPANNADRTEALVRSLWRVARIVNRKYACIRTAMWAIAAGTVLATMAIALDMAP